jgi:hypothetical protein
MGISVYYECPRSPTHPILDWSSTWRGKDQETAEFCSRIYVAMLANLKNKLK